MVLIRSHQANLSGSGGSSLPSQVKIVLVIVTIILCSVVMPCESRNNQLSCGKRLKKLMSSRITWGAQAQLGEFPWHAAIFSSAYNKPKYVCGGSIIHRRAVISSAHCFVSFNRMVHEDLITVHVGRVDLNETTEHQQVLNVSKIIPHPKFFTLVGTENDIAILKLYKDIVMSASVYPVCVWDTADDHSQLVGKKGTVVGFGMNENDEMPSNLQKAELTVVDIYDCLDNDRAAYGPVLTRNMYCAGGEENVSACNGDSGGGMFFEENDTWYIRGIISFIAMRPNAALCDTSKYTIFTDVSRFSGWFRELMVPDITAPIAFDAMSESPAAERPWHETPCKDKTVPKNGTCNVAHLFEHNFLLYGDFSQILRMPLKGGQPLPVSANMPTALDYDCAEGRFYWSEYSANRIISAYYNGTNHQLFIEKDIKSPGSVAVDWISRRLYWTNNVKNTIEVASLEDPNLRTVLIYENAYPYNIAVDPLRSKLYWANSLDLITIECSNLDGTNRQVLVSSPKISGVRNMKVSTATGELCYADEGLGLLGCIDPVSKQIRTIVSKLNEPRQIAITDELFYWTDRISFNIECINSKGVRQDPIVLPGHDFSRTTVMTAVSDNCPLFYSPCAINNGNCPGNTICLVNSGAPGGKSCIVKKKV